MERRLVAIMAVDAIGYSRLIRADEEGTIAALKARQGVEEVDCIKLGGRHGHR